MNLGKVTRNAALVAFAVSALSANAQTVNMWWNKSGDAATSQPGTVDVLAGSTVTLSFYVSTADFTSNLSSVSTMVGFDTTNAMGNAATASGNGITIFHTGTDASPTGLPLTYAAPFASGLQLNSFGGGYDTSSSSRPYGLWTTSSLISGDFGVSSVTAAKVFDLTFTVDGSLTAGTLRPITIYAAQALPGFFDTEVMDSNFVTAGPQSYTANLRVVNPVPEPASMAALGLGALALLRRRKK